MNDGVKQIYERIIDTDVSEMGTAERREFTKYIMAAFITNRAASGLFKWLGASGYYNCPAGKGHHGACRGGLFIHSFEVTRQLVLLTELYQLEWMDNGSPIIIGILHDVCKLHEYDYDFDSKIDIQEKYFTGKGPIEYRPTFESGHGSKSILMLSSKILLTEEEALCIRYHMGAYTDSSEWRFYDEAIKTCPNVFWTHTADMIASKLERK